jgi:hypothetical protein
MSEADFVVILYLLLYIFAHSGIYAFDITRIGGYRFHTGLFLHFQEIV